MCVPQGMVALQALSAVGQAIQQQEQNKQTQSRLTQQAANARTQAEKERRQGQLASNRKKVETQSLLSRQRNALAAAGVDTDSGSAHDLQSATRRTSESDRKEGLRRAEERALGYDNQANESLNSLAYNKRKARSDTLKQGSTILTRNFSTFNKRGLLRY